MTKARFWAVVIVMLVLTTSISAQTTQPAIVLQVRNYAHVPSFILARAERDVIEIYRRAGVSAIWTECDIDEKNPSPCTVVTAQSGRFVTFYIQVLSHSASHPPSKAMGMAKPGCSIATIFYDRVEAYLPNFSGLNGDSITARVLAYVIVHETGHLLLASANHSKDGIMRARWQRTDFVAIDNLTSRFTDRDLQLMKHHLADDEIFRP